MQTQPTLKINRIICILKEATESDFETASFLILNESLETIDKYLILIIISYYYLSGYWNWIKESCSINYPTYIISHNFHYCYLILLYIKGLRWTHIDSIVYEGIRAVCLNNRIDQLNALIKISEELNRPIRFDAFKNDLLKKCRERNLNEVVSIIEFHIEPKK